jgi:hypothetical protein
VLADQHDEHAEIEAGAEGAGDSGGEQLAGILHEPGLEQPACQTVEPRTAARLAHAGW